MDHESKRRGATVDDEPTADDLSPETMIKEDHPNPADKILREVDESSIGASHPPHRDETAPKRGPGRMHSRNRGA